MNIYIILGILAKNHVQATAILEFLVFCDIMAKFASAEIIHMPVSHVRAKIRKCPHG